ncbi:helix-turn-helix domain-containing protein [Mariniflexile sp. HMF6888]|uniref:helix-turn-helix domain-containing protein n=1 Tax=Mariniflexile sp. HMF6888 TaxID=3373086 RepID=UPI0037AFACF3
MELERIDKVVMYIWQHLDQELKLEKLAATGHYSPYHFLRVFKSVTGETPNKYITRLRMESAAHTIILNPERPILNIAMEVGYQSLESFSRAFKAFYSISPQKFKTSEQSEKLTIIQKRNLNSFIHKIIQASDNGQTPNHSNENDYPDVEILKLPEQKLITFQTYMVSLEKLTDGFKNMTRWATAHDQIEEGQYPFGMLNDFPLFTPLDKCRFLVCIPVKYKDLVTKPMHYLEIPPRKYSKFICNGDIDNIIRVMIYVAHQWLPEAGYKVINEMAMMIPINNPSKIPFNKNTYEILMPIVPA